MVKVRRPKAGHGSGAPAVRALTFRLDLPEPYAGRWLDLDVLALQRLGAAGAQQDLEALARCIGAWNLVDANGAALPCNGTGLRRVGGRFLKALMAALSAAGEAYTKEKVNG